MCNVQCAMYNVQCTPNGTEPTEIVHTIKRPYISPSREEYTVVFYEGGNPCTMCNVQLLQRQGSQQPFMLNNLTNCRQCLYADGRDKRCNFRQYTA